MQSSQYASHDTQQYSQQFEKSKGLYKEMQREM